MEGGGVEEVVHDGEIGAGAFGDRLECGLIDRIIGCYGADLI